MHYIQLHDGSVLVVDDDKKLTKIDNPSGMQTSIQLKGEVNNYPGQVAVDGKVLEEKK